MSVWPFLNTITDILLGTHWESGAVTFWSHAVSLPLASNAIFSWKFCHMVHKLLRDGHPNVSPSNLSNTWHHILNIAEMGVRQYSGMTLYWAKKAFVVYIILQYYRRRMTCMEICFKVCKTKLVFFLLFLFCFKEHYGRLSVIHLKWFSTCTAAVVLYGVLWCTEIFILMHTYYRRIKQLNLSPVLLLAFTSNVVHYICNSDNSESAFEYFYVTNRLNCAICFDWMWSHGLVITTFLLAQLPDPAR